jgi:hypothetical protein
LAAGFFAAAFFTAATFFAAGLAAGFFAADFFGAALAAGFLVALAAFFAGFFAATSGVSSVPSNERSNICKVAHAAVRDGQSWGRSWKKQCAFRQSDDMTLYLESALLYPAPATAATARQCSICAVEGAEKWAQLMRPTHCRQ